jgi:hypothetical protein
LGLILKFASRSLTTLIRSELGLKSIPYASPAGVVSNPVPIEPLADPDPGHGPQFRERAGARGVEAGKDLRPFDDPDGRDGAGTGGAQREHRCADGQTPG